MLTITGCTASTRRSGMPKSKMRRARCSLLSKSTANRRDGNGVSVNAPVNRLILILSNRDYSTSVANAAMSGLQSRRDSSQVHGAMARNHRRYVWAHSQASMAYGQVLRGLEIDYGSRVCFRYSATKVQKCSDNPSQRRRYAKTKPALHMHRRKRQDFRPLSIPQLLSHKSYTNHQPLVDPNCQHATHRSSSTQSAHHPC